jgi:hypothetical protein
MGLLEQIDAKCLTDVIVAAAFAHLSMSSSIRALQFSLMSKIGQKGGATGHPSPGIDRLRSSYWDELALRFLTTSIAFTTCRTFGTPVAAFSAFARRSSELTSPVRVTTPFFTV